MNKTSIYLIFSVVFLVAVFSFLSPANAIEQSDSINFGDTVIVKISAEPEMGGVFAIDDQGTLNLPSVGGIDIGQLSVVGLTPVQVQEELSRRLSEYYVNSDSSVTLTSSAKFVSIYGHVQNAGATQYKENMKMLDLFIYARGLTSDADPTRVSIFREDAKETIILDVTELLDGVNGESNIELKPGDYIMVPSTHSTTRIKVIALGKVSAPGSVYVPKGSRLMDVYAESGGSTGRASLARTYIIRMVDNKPQVIHCDIKRLISRADMTQNVEVKDGDIFFIPESDGVDIMKVINEILDINLLKNTLESDF